MHRMIIAALSFFFALANAADAPSLRRVDLNASGAMERLALEDPAHHAKVQRILAEIQRQSVDSVPIWMKTNFGADQVDYSQMIKTSDPAKKHLHFTLDNTRYSAVLTQLQTERLVPAR